MAEIVVDDVWAEGSTVWSSVEVPRTCQKYFSGEPFFVDYDIDVSDVPEALLTVPVLSQVCPVAWAVGADVRADAVPRRFLDSLGTVEDVLGAMYPSLMDGGDVIAGETVDATSAYGNASDVGMLFTGGVDSLATYVRNREKDPTLINVQGWVIGIDEDERWERTRTVIDGYGDRFGAETQFVRSNMLSFLDQTVLTTHFDHYHDGGWYSAVGGGVGLLGLCAPLTATLDMGELYIAATHWEEFPNPEVVSHWDGSAIPWGSHPDIDDEVEWGATEAVHDGFDLTRQGRIGVIADYVEDVDPGLPVRSCAGSETAENCNRCEKCFRTALGIAIEGVDPNENGFELDRSSFEDAIERIRAGEWLDDDHHAVYWKDLRRRASSVEEFPVEGTSEFVDALQDVDFEEIAGPPRRDRLLRAVARRTPETAFSLLYRAYDSLWRDGGRGNVAASGPGVEDPDPGPSRNEPT